MSNDLERPPAADEHPANDDQGAALNELLFRLARLLGRQAAEDQIRQLRAANDNGPVGGGRVERTQAQ